MRSSAAAKAYYEVADYYSTCPGDWLGKGAEKLGLIGSHNPMHFYSLADNLDPRTGEKLRPYARDGERVGMDLTFNSTKSVGVARELAGPENAGDPRIEEAHREAVIYAMGFVEADMQTRVRGGRDGNRVTGNMVAYRVTHRDTRINADDQKPDMSLHDHVFVFNTTYDKIEGKWKACEMGQIKHDAPYYEALYHARLASNLKELGYGIRRKDKSFEIAGISDELTKKFSRRNEYIKSVAAKLGITNPKSKDKLGATTRLGKTKELADDLNGYYVSRLTKEEKQALQTLEGRSSYQSTDQKAVEYAIGYLFERKSVVEERKVYETALRNGIGSATVEGVQKEAKKQGLLVKGIEATTKAVLAEEDRIITFAREGRGTMRPLGFDQTTRGLTPASDGKLAVIVDNSGRSKQDEIAILSTFSQQKGRPDESKRPFGGSNPHSSVDEVKPDNPSPRARDITTLSLEQQAKGLYTSAPAKDTNPGSLLHGLSAEQAAIARHVWDSPDRVILIRGAAGTGKTHTMKATIAGIDKPVVVLAPSADASRGVLRKEGFAEADTVMKFLSDEKFQQKAKNGVIWVDEAGLLGMRQLRQIFDAAEKLNARVVLQGDRRQHGSIERGATLRVLEEFAGLPVAELKDIRRQRGEYKSAIESLSKGDILAGYDKLAGLGWVKKVDDNKALVGDYLAALDGKKTALVVAPTHIEGNEITEEIRTKLKERGIVSKDEKEFTHYRPLHWTDAEKGDLGRYEGSEILFFHRNSGTFKAGERVRIADWPVGGKSGGSANYSVYTAEQINLAKGDSIRITANGKTKDGHKLNNGSQYTVRGFTSKGDITLTNGWVIGKDFSHLTHGYVTTSYASQGKTVDRVLIAMGSESVPAISAEQFYVSASRGKESAKVYSDMAPERLREAIQKTDTRKSATELFKPKRKPSKIRKLIDRIKRVYGMLRDQTADAIRMKQPEKERDYVSR